MDEKVYRLNELHKNNKDIFKYHNCLCGFNDDELIATKDRYGLECNFVICKNCGLIRMNPYYTEDFLNVFYQEFYSPIYRNGKYCSDEFFKNMSNIRGKYIINRIESSIDISFKDLHFYNMENVICLYFSHIIEHIIDPHTFLNNVMELIHRDGYLYIEIPTLESIVYHHNLDISDSFQSAHIYYYTEFNFIKLLKKIDLFIIDKYYEYIKGRGVGFLCKKVKLNKNNYNFGYFYTSSFLNNYNYLKNINHNIIKFKTELETIEAKLNKIINSLAWWIPIRKLRDSFRNKMLNYRPDQTRPDQTRPDQTRMRLHKEYAHLNDTLINNKFQPILQNKIAA